MAPLKILLVEDNPDHAELEIRTIKKTNYDVKVDWVRDGREALDYVFNQGNYTDRREYVSPALILLDINLPIIDGLTVLKKIKSDPATETIPVLRSLRR